MRLLIAREAVDAHLSVRPSPGKLIEPDVALAERARTAAR